MRRREGNRFLYWWIAFVAFWFVLLAFFGRENPHAGGGKADWSGRTYGGYGKGQ